MYWVIPLDFEFHINPFTHQLQSLLWSIPRNDIALFLEMGTGKTKVVIDWIRWNKIKNAILVITVNFPLAHNWIEEFRMNYPSLKGAVLEGSKDERINLLKKNKDFYIINYEGLKVIWDELYKRQWNSLILDESRRCKNIKALRSKLCIELGKNIPYKAILTGTPTVHPLDIFTQYLFLDNGETYGKNFYRCRNKYFVNKGWGMFQKWVLRKETEKEFLELMNNNCIRFTKKETLDLPEKIYQNLNINLSQEQKADYMKLLVGDRLLNIADLTHLELINLFIKYSQITGGFIKVGENDYKFYKENPKLDTLMDIIEDSIDDTKVTIFHRFIAEGRLIENKLKEKGIKYASMRSEVTNTTAEYQKYLQKDNVRVMIAHPQSGGIGLNFVQSSVCVFYSMDYNIEYSLQAQDRLHRIGQKNNVNYIYLLGQYTIDEEIYKAHKEGISLMKRVNDYKLKIDEILTGGGMRWKEKY